MPNESANSLAESRKFECVALKSDATSAQTRGATLRHSVRVSYDGRVTPPDAARLLGVSLRTLRRMREERRGPHAVRMPLWGHSWSYHLSELTIRS
jgi:hypothetical protein